MAGFVDSLHSDIPENRLEPHNHPVASLDSLGQALLGWEPQLDSLDLDSPDLEFQFASSPVPKNRQEHSVEPHTQERRMWEHSMDNYIEVLRRDSHIGALLLGSHIEVNQLEHKWALGLERSQTAQEPRSLLESW